MSKWMTSRHIQYIQCCKLWLEFNKTSNHSVLLIGKLTYKVYYKLQQEFMFIQVVYNELANKAVITNDDLDVIDKELAKYPAFFESMIYVIEAMNSSNNSN